MNARLVEGSRIRETSPATISPFELCPADYSSRSSLAVALSGAEIVNRDHVLCYRGAEQPELHGWGWAASTFAGSAQISEAHCIVFCPFSQGNPGNIDDHGAVTRAWGFLAATGTINLTSSNSGTVDRGRTATAGGLTAAAIHPSRTAVLFAANVIPGRWITAEGNLGWTAPNQTPLHPPGEDAGTLARFQTILDTWRGNLFTETLNRMNRQLSHLLEDEGDLAELLRAPDPKSFEALLTYLAARPWAKAPSMTLTREGFFVANWRPAAQEKARLSVDFLDEERVRWSAVDARDAKSPTMTGGICSILELDEHLGRYRDWLVL